MAKSDPYSKANQYEECTDHEESIDAGDCDAKTGASYRFVRAELWPAGERQEGSMQSVHHAFIKLKAGDFVPADANFIPGRLVPFSRFRCSPASS